MRRGRSEDRPHNFAGDRFAGDDLDRPHNFAGDDLDRPADHDHCLGG